MKSIISNEQRCFVCGRRGCLEKHHCLHGSSRKKADDDGLWVYLCENCHRGTQGVHGRDGHDLDQELKELAQSRWEETYGTREEFVHRYGKSWR